MQTASFTYSTNFLYPVRCVRSRKGNERSLQNLSKGFKTVGISDATRRKIATAARALSWAAEPIKVRNRKGEITTHLISFVTLTLCAEQQHDDAYVTKNILGTFLDRCRKLGIFKNYVWRAEKQRNGNIHYHLLSDSFASFSTIKKMWLIALRSEGYLQRFTEKFSSMSFAEYSRQKFNAEKTPEKVAAAYAAGIRSGWQNPPCCDVVSIDTPEGVSRYVSKYISKSDDDNPNIVTGRTWACSQSVNAAVTGLKSDPDFCKNWYNAGAEILRREVFSADFFSVVKCKLSSIVAWFPDMRRALLQLLRRHFEPCAYHLRYSGFFPLS